MAVDYIGSETGLFSGLIEPASAAKASYYTYQTGWNTKADLSNFTNLTKYVQNTSINKYILGNLSKKGTSMVKFGDGTDPKTIIIAGMHGNELPSQVAALRLINYLSKNTTKIKGTIEIIPILSPTSTLLGQREFSGKDLNRATYTNGTITKTLLTIITKSEKTGVKATAVGDFHGTAPGGIPGKNVILSTKSSSKSVHMAKYMTEYTKHAHDTNLLAKETYKGAFSNVVNKKGITTVIAEVKSPMGTVAKGSDTASYKQMMALLKYNKNL